MFLESASTLEMFGSKRCFSIVTSEYLAHRLKLMDKQNLLLLVIDVREPENYVKGHISNAVNYDSQTLLNWKRIDSELLDKLKRSKKQVELYFHCHLSLIRGPSSAGHIENLLQSDPFLKNKVKVFLVEGGWKRWKREYPDMVEQQ